MKENSSSFFERSMLFLGDYWGNLLSIGGSAGLAVAGILPKIEKGEWIWFSTTGYGALFVLGVTAVVVGQFFQAISTPGNKSLKEELQKAIEALNKRTKGYLEVINNELLVLFEISNFRETERISLYNHDGTTLIMVGRYSSNPNLKKKGRGFHNENEGVIGRAWANGKAFVDDLPESSNNDDYVYVRECVITWGMKREEAVNLSMKSRTIAAFSINDSQNNRSAVIVFESTNPQGFDEQYIETLMRNGESRRISLLLEKLQSITPNPSTALQEGF